MAESPVAKRARTDSCQKVSIIGVPSWGGQRRAGVHEAPKVFRESGLIKKLVELGIEVEDTGDVDPQQFRTTRPGNDAVANCFNCSYIGGLAKAVSEKTKECAAKRSTVLTLGGDHSITIGSIYGLRQQYPNMRILYIHAHSDINTPEISSSGNMHGMTLGFLLQIVETKRYKGLEWLVDKIRAEHIAFIGLRGVEPSERELLRKHNIKCWTMKDIDEHGIARVVDDALHYLRPNGDEPLHLSFDIDAIDPIFAPATGTAVPGGLTVREGRYICEAVHATGTLVGMDLVEVNPFLGDPTGVKQTFNTAIQMIETALGKTLL